ncbi:MAG: tetratricopeptide repeat protein, partial [Emcibacteraceae bacterium]|nr:tetratricopeptide repeat protein [Emcibacteraceae bacterium]
MPYNVVAQVLALTPNVQAVEQEIYIPREPTNVELARYALNSEIEALWSAIYSDPFNGVLRQQIASKYNELGNGDIAENEILRALALGVERGQVLGELGNAYLDQGKVDQIFQEINIDEADREILGEVYLVMGAAYYKRDNFREAFLNYYQADVLIDDRYELDAPLARLYSHMGDYDKAEYHMDKALTQESRDAAMLVLKGELVHRHSGAEKSFKYFELANFYSEDNDQVQSRLAGALYDLGKSEEAMVILRDMLARDSRNPYANFMTATLFAEGNNIRTALRYLNQAGFNAYVDANSALMLWGQLGYATNDFDATVRTLNQYIKNDPDDVDVRKLLGAAYLKQNRSTDAARILQYLVDENIADGAALLLLGSAYVGAGDNDQGALYLSQANDNDPTNLSNVDERRLNEYELGQKFGVSLNLSTLLTQGNLTNSQYALAGYKALGDENFQDAYEVAAALVEQNKTGALGYNLLGLAYLGQGQIDYARSNFIRALDLDPDFHQARVQLAKIDFARGDDNNG